MSPNAVFRLRIVLLSLVILVLSQGMTAALIVDAFEDAASESVAERFGAVQDYFVDGVEKLLRFGKPVEKLYGLDQIVARSLGEAEGLDQVRLIHPDGRLLYGKGSPLPDTFLDRAEAGERVATDMYGERHLLAPVRGPTGAVVAVADAVYPRSLVQSEANALWNTVRLVLAVVVPGAGLVLYLLMFFAVEAKRRRLALVLVFLVLALAQVGFVAAVGESFRDRYVDAAADQAATVARLARADIEPLLQRGLSLEAIPGLDTFLGGLLHDHRVLGAVSLLDADGDSVHTAERRQEQPPTVALAGPAREIVVPFAGGEVRVLLSRPHVAAKLRAIGLDALTMTVIAFLFMRELFTLLRVTMDSRSRAGRLDTPMLARPAAFGFLFGWALPASFIPLRMEELYEPIAGLSREVVLGLPISAEMLCALGTALLAGAWSDRKGWRQPFSAGIVLAVVGAIVSGRAETGLGFILARGLAGLGYGLAWMSIQSCVFGAGAASKALAVAGMVAGIIAGHICGTAVGAMLAERFGYGFVFMASAAGMCIPLAFAWIAMRSKQQGEGACTIPQARLADLVRLVANPSYAAVLLLSIVPFSICQVGLLFYATPIHLKDMGLSQSTIGRVLMVYGLSVVLLGPMLGRLVDRFASKKVFIALGAIVGGAGLLAPLSAEGLPPILLAVFLLGLSSSIGGAAQSVYALRLPVTQSVGAGRAMAIQRAADKLGQMAGPLAFGGLIASVGMNAGVALAGVGFALCGLVFFVLARRDV
jgi:predicted MFS family arabinose efflux permease